MAGIFGPTGREAFRNIQRERAQEAAARGQAAGSMSPTQMLGQAGSFLGLALEQGVAGEDPQVTRARKLQAAQAELQRSGVSANDPVAFNEALAEALQNQGLSEEAGEAGREASRIQREQVEEANIQSLISARFSKQEQAREDELAREARAAEGEAGRESREEIARLDRESRERIAAERRASQGSGAKPKVARAASASDRSQAEAALREFNEEGFKDLNAQDQKNAVATVAQRARDIAQANPGTLYEDAVQQALEAVAPGIQEKPGVGGFFADIFGAGSTFAPPGRATAGGQTGATPSGFTFTRKN